MHFHTVLTGL